MQHRALVVKLTLSVKAARHIGDARSAQPPPLFATVILAELKALWQVLLDGCLGKSACKGKDESPRARLGWRGRLRRCGPQGGRGLQSLGVLGDRACPSSPGVASTASRCRGPRPPRCRDRHLRRMMASRNGVLNHLVCGLLLQHKLRQRQQQCALRRRPRKLTRPEHQGSHANAEGGRSSFLGSPGGTHTSRG